MRQAAYDPRDDSRMKILIVGAGATGIAVGVRLAEADRDVTYLVRPERRRRLERHGVLLTEPAGEHRLEASATTADALTGPFDLIVIAVKAAAIAGVIEDIAPAVGPTTVIVPLLNGLRHLDLLSGRYPGRVAGGLMKIVATVDKEGGAVQMTPLAEITIGSLETTSQLGPIVALLDVPGLTVIEADDIRLRLWEKWAFIASAGIITCLFDNTVGRIQEAGGRRYIDAAIAETEAVAIAAGYPPRAAAHAQSLHILAEPGSAFTSSLFRDLKAGGRTEAEHILGDLADRASELAIPTPLLDLTLVRLRAAELDRSHSAI
jgi:2-dehydropantoate 2-reductase